MSRQLEKAYATVGARNGAWGEAKAVEYLRCHGYEIVERNARPVAKDHRLELDIIAWDRENDTMVLVEVKQHAKLSPYSRRLRSIDRKKRDNVRRAFNAWRRINGWEGGFRFDVIEVYGVPSGGSPIIDHMENVRLFARSNRFVKWSDD